MAEGLRYDLQRNARGECRCRVNVPQIVKSNRAHAIPLDEAVEHAREFVRVLYGAVERVEDVSVGRSDSEREVPRNLSDAMLLKGPALGNRMAVLPQFLLGIGTVFGAMAASLLGGDWSALLQLL